MKKILGFAGAIALSIIPTPSFSGEVEQKEMMSVTEQLLPQIGEKYKNLDIIFTFRYGGCCILQTQNI